MLVVVIFMLAILILSLSVALPRVRESIQRDREEETMQRGKQYIRAVQLYYRKFNAYPPNVDALVKTNNIRFLRKKYIDPTTGKDEWKAIMYCQNKTPQAMGFFGQPLAGAGCGLAAGTGPIGGGTGLGTPAGSGTGSASTSGGLGLFNSSPGATTGSGAGATGAQSGTGGTDANGNPTDSRNRNQWHRLGLWFVEQPYRQRSDPWRWRHHRLLPAKPQAVPDGLQEEEPLQRVGVPLQSLDGSAKHGRRKYRHDRPASQWNHDSRRRIRHHNTYNPDHPHDDDNTATIESCKRNEARPSGRASLLA